MFTFLLVVFLMIAVLLIFTVLIQIGRGAELGAAFGGLNQANMPQTPENFLGKLTTYLAIFFMILAFSLAFLSTKEIGKSALDKVQVPVAPQNLDATSQK